jgi:glucose/arabinose dehydrogenase
MRAWFWVGLLFGAPASAYATIPDPNFVETPLFGGLPTLTGLARAPDGSDRMFILQKEGIVRVVEAGGLLPAPFATISPIFLNSECGLIGMAFDPDFVNNHYVYFFVTVSATEQQIQRYTDVNNVGQSPTVILGGLPTRGRNHDGGGLGFGPDGKIYWSIGDNGNLTGGNADLTTLASKIGRANRDGTVPTDNPFYDGAGPNNDYIWARGFRNPFTMTFHPANGKLISSVVGSLYEQVFVVSAGDHAGWNTYENNQVAGYITPIIAYRTNGVDVRAITAIARSNGVLSVTTGAGANRFRRGMRVTLAGIGDPSMNGEVLVGDTPTPNVFQAIQPGPDASSSGGTAINQGFGGAITGGTFYDSTGFDAVHRGAFFFGDFNSGQLMRVPFDAQFRVERIDVFGTNLGATVDAEVAPDGNLWIGELGGRIFEIAQVQSAQGLIVTPLHLQVVEGGGAAITVRLAQDPGAPWVVTTSVQGDPDVGVVQGATLTFDSSNWRVPQPVVLAAAFDPDADADTRHRQLERRRTFARFGGGPGPGSTPVLAAFGRQPPGDRRFDRRLHRGPLQPARDLGDGVGDLNPRRVGDSPRGQLELRPGRLRRAPGGGGGAGLGSRYIQWNGVPPGRDLGGATGAGDRADPRRRSRLTGRRPPRRGPRRSRDPGRDARRPGPRGSRDHAGRRLDRRWPGGRRQRLGSRRIGARRPGPVGQRPQRRRRQRLCLPRVGAFVGVPHRALAPLGPGPPQAPAPQAQPHLLSWGPAWPDPGPVALSGS